MFQELRSQYHLAVNLTAWTFMNEINEVVGPHRAI